MGVWDDGPVAEEDWQRDYHTLRTHRGAEPQPLLANVERGSIARPDLYARERPLRGVVGSAVFYRYELWHRGSAMKPAGLRIMHSFAFRRADAPWLGGVAAGYGLEASRMPREWMGTLSPAQRSRFGFPAPGDEYWTPDTIEGVAEHYGNGIDMQPYRAALGAAGAPVAVEAAAALRVAELAAHSAAAAAEPKVELPAVAGRWHFDPTTPFFAAEACADGDAPLSAAQIGRWHTDGLLVLHGLLPEEMCAAAAACHSAGAKPRPNDRGRSGQFPYDADEAVLNDLTLHPRLLGAAAQVLGTRVSEIIHPATWTVLHLDGPDHLGLWAGAWDEGF